MPCYRIDYYGSFGLTIFESQFCVFTNPPRSVYYGTTPRRVVTPCSAEELISHHWQKQFCDKTFSAEELWNYWQSTGWHDKYLPLLESYLIDDTDYG